jgi:hypothetical protein
MDVLHAHGVRHRAFRAQIWLSHLAGGQGVAGSNPVVPTDTRGPLTGGNSRSAALLLMCRQIRPKVVRIPLGPPWDQAPFQGATCGYRRWSRAPGRSGCAGSSRSCPRRRSSRERRRRRAGSSRSSRSRSSVGSRFLKVAMRETEAVVGRVNREARGLAESLGREGGTELDLVLPASVCGSR